MFRQISQDGKWKRVETVVTAKATNHYSSLQITTTSEGSYLLDQVSVMPWDTYMVSKTNKHTSYYHHEYAK